MTRSIDPILVSLTPYTAVPSTLSLPIREPVSLVPVTIVEPPSVEERATGSTKNRSRKVIHDPITQTGHFRNSAGPVQARNWNLGDRRDLFGERKLSGQARAMNKNHSKGRIGSPVVFAMAVAVFGVLAMLIVDHGPWSKSHLQTAEMVDYPTTSAAAKAAGATVTPTTPKTQLEPIAPGPKPAQPAIPVPGAGMP
jgi:hypothetical protein